MELSEEDFADVAHLLPESMVTLIGLIGIEAAFALVKPTKTSCRAKPMCTKPNRKTRKKRMRPYALLRFTGRLKR